LTVAIPTQSWGHKKTKKSLSSREGGDSAIGKLIQIVPHVRVEEKTKIIAA